MNDYKIIIEIDCVPGENEQDALMKIQDILNGIGETEYLENTTLKVEKEGEWMGNE